MTEDEPKHAELPRLTPLDDAGGRWGRLARRLGLLAVGRKGLLGPSVRVLVGERGGYLVAISPSHSLNTSSVDVLVRYPRGHTVRGLREDLRRKVRRRRRKHLHVGDGAVVQRLPFAVFPPTARSVERATDDLLAAMRDHVPPLDRRCESCDTAHDLGMYLAEGVPGVYCAPCIDEFVRGEREFAETVRSLEPDYERGAGLGALAALAVGIALGCVGVFPAVYAGKLAVALTIPVFVALGYLVSAVASRGFVGSSVGSAALTLVFALLGVPVTFAVMNAMTTMTLHPAEWTPRFLFFSLWGPLRGAPRTFAIYAAAAAVGWLVETIVYAVSRRTPVRRTRIERIERPAGIM